MRISRSLTAGVLMDSFDIAQWADKHGKGKAGKKLFPDGQLQAISKYDIPLICILVLRNDTLYHIARTCLK